MHAASTDPLPSQLLWRRKARDDEHNEEDDSAWTAMDDDVSDFDNEDGNDDEVAHVDNDDGTSSANNDGDKPTIHDDSGT